MSYRKPRRWIERLQLSLAADRTHLAFFEQRRPFTEYLEKQAWLWSDDEMELFLFDGVRYGKIKRVVLDPTVRTWIRGAGQVTTR